MENFGTQAGQAPHRALWNYNLAKQSQSVFLNLATAGIPEGVDVPQGTLLDVDLQTREASIVKNALVVAGGTTSAPRVAKGHFFKAGDFVFVTGDAVAVSSVDTTNADYDVLTLSGACTGATAGNYLEQAKASGASPELAHIPNLISSEWLYDFHDGNTISCVAEIFSDVDTSVFYTPISPTMIAKINATGRYLLY
ncbi:MAG: hypothetical protein PHF34_03975 [Bacteroidales bacterium]|nr:hypothetical protein [Bacteroidales bacterium]